MVFVPAEQLLKLTAKVKRFYPYREPKETLPGLLKLKNLTLIKY
jgi:hypothetical protein